MTEFARAYQPRQLAPLTTQSYGLGPLPQPPPGLAPDTFAARLYGMLGPLTQLDSASAWSLLIYVNAIGLGFQQVEDLVRDTPDGPGWSSLLDVERCPPEALGWLAQLAGVRLLPSDDEATNRERIQSTDGFRRGTVAAIVGAARATLTGNRTVLVFERSGDPSNTPEYAYFLTIATYAGQTPNPTATRMGILAQKPGGIVLDFRVVAGQIYDQVRARFESYAALRVAYPNYLAVWQDTPEDDL